LTWAYTIAVSNHVVQRMLRLGNVKGRLGKGQFSKAGIEHVQDGELLNPTFNLWARTLSKNTVLSRYK